MTFPPLPPESASDPSDGAGADYDNDPYVNVTFDFTAPHFVFGAARLFGLDAPKLDGARILELGCGRGGNLIALAYYNPNAQFVGVDLARRQIDEARGLAECLKLPNVRFEHMSVEDIQDSFGEYDYIFAHGLLSWTPPAVRKKIFSVSKRNLAPGGLAMLSFNALPGWHSVRGLRDLMLFHARNTPEMAQRVRMGREIVELLSKQSIQTPPLVQAAKREAAIFGRAPDNYIIHDHLGAHNHAYYLTEFAEIARESGLRFVTDTDISMLGMALLPEPARRVALSGADMIEQQQYCDFFVDQRFRRAILCHEDARPVYRIDTEIIEKLQFIPKKPIPDEIRNLRPREVREVSWSCGLFSQKTSDPLTVAALRNIGGRSPQLATGAEIADAAVDEAFAGEALDAPARADRRQRVLAYLTNSTLQGFFLPASERPAGRPSGDASKPRFNTLVRKRMEDSEASAATSLHLEFRFDDLDRLLAPLMDGRRTAEEIMESVSQRAARGEIRLNAPANAQAPTSEPDSRAAQLVKVKLAAYAAHGLLE
ncbi:MAG: lysine methyltransferase [Parvularculaceae bacterium]